MLHTAFRLLWRDWKGGELNLLVLSLLIAITTVTSIGLFTDRITNTLNSQAGNLIAADAQVRGSMDVGPKWRAKARELNLAMADVIGFRAMAFSEAGAQLASVKAVSGSYPLKGLLKISGEAFGQSREVAQGPEPGEVWLSSRLFAALDVSVGDVIALGETEFLITAALISEPDGAQSMFGVGPRVMMHSDDVETTGAVQVGSRINFQWLLAGEPQNVEAMKLWLEDEKRLGDHHRWVGIKDGNQGVTQAMERAERFLLLAGSLGVILSCSALALAARRYSQRQLSHVALLKTLGLTPNHITRIYLFSLLLLALISVTLGLVLGWLIHWFFITAFSSLLPPELAQASSRPYWVGGVTGLVSLIAFAAPPILSLRQIPPARVLRANAGGILHQGWSFVIGLMAVFFLVLWYSQSLMLTGGLIAGALIAVIGVSLLAGLIIALSRRLASGLSKSWRIGLASLYRHSRQNSIQVMIFSVSLLLLFVITLVRTSLISDWQRQIPEGAANHFAFNIFEEERAGIEAFFAENQIEPNPFYPMVRGRVTAVSGTPVAEIILADGSEAQEQERELNLTWGADLGDDNEILDGRWWQPGDDERLLVSVEQGFAEELGIEVGDMVSYSVSGNPLQAKVTSIRSVKWDSMNPNFFMIFSQPLLDGTTSSLLTSFYLPPEKKVLLNDLLYNHPTITLVEVDQMIEQVQSIISQVSRAIEFILVLVLVSGILVLVASIQATLDTRFQESAILRTLGARSGLVSGALMIEFGALGFLAGCLAVLGAEATIALLQINVFEMEVVWHPVLWLIGPWVGLLVICAIGVASTRKVIRTPPMEVFRGL